MLGDVQVTTNTATVTGAHPIIAFTCNGVWVYALSDQAQAHIKDLIKGKTTQDALHLLQSLPGIERVSTSWDVNMKLPKDISYIHLMIFYGL
jgi:VCBS repeat-containing protein